MPNLTGNDKLHKPFFGHQSVSKCFPIKCRVVAFANASLANTMHKTEQNWKYVAIGLGVKHTGQFLSGV